MVRKIQRKSRDEVKNIYKFIEDYIFENRKLCSASEIVKSLKISRTKCLRILNELVSKGKITIAYKGKGNPNIYIPTYLFEEILRAQPEPSWIEKYTFKKKLDISMKIKQMREQILHYEKIERLLYSTGEPLEDALRYVLEYLGFENVVRLQEKDSYDVSFTHNGIKYIVEVEGTTKQGKKEKVTQLYGWIEKELNMGANPDKIVGVLVVNHFRDRDPEERGEPLTREAKRFLKYHRTRFIFFTTMFLFNIVKKVDEGSLAKEEARKMVIKGERYE